MSLVQKSDRDTLSQEKEGEESAGHLDRRLALEDRKLGLPVRDKRLRQLDGLIRDLQDLERADNLSGYPNWKADAARVTHTLSHIDTRTHACTHARTHAHIHTSKLSQTIPIKTFA